MKVFRGKLESACLSVCLSVCVQNTSVCQSASGGITFSDNSKFFPNLKLLSSKSFCLKLLFGKELTYQNIPNNLYPTTNFLIGILCSHKQFLHNRLTNLMKLNE